MNVLWPLLQSTTSQSDSGAASAEDEGEQAKAIAKAAAKKAKKQKQKANKKSLLASPSSAGPAAHDATSPASISSAAIAAAAGESASPGMTVSNGNPSLDLERLTVSSEADTERARFLEELFCCPLTKVRPSCLQFLSDAFVSMDL